MLKYAEYIKNKIEASDDEADDQEDEDGVVSTFSHFVDFLPCC